MMISIVAFAYSPDGTHAIVLDDVCIGCGACVEVCSEGAIESGSPVVIDADKCDACGKCMDTCPIGAIWLKRIG